MQPLGALPVGRTMPHNSSHREDMGHVDKPQKNQYGNRGGVWLGAGGALAPSTSSPFPPEPPGASGSIIPVYCALLATVVLGLLAYVAFKWFSLLPTAGAHVNKDSNWPKLGLRSWGASTGTICLGLAVSSRTLLAAWSPVPPVRGHILNLAADFTSISLRSSGRQWSSSWRPQVNLTKAGRAWQATWATKLRLWRPWPRARCQPTPC
uniref:Tumor necrosis factor receptor member 16 transmembrane domain-containing protein n=1 Tax=Catagonus wagneri TaxID=51154 RepID=A0A8C3YN21_9CETA